MINDPRTAYLNTHATTSVQGASPHKLITLLFAACQENLAVAKGGIERGDVRGKAVAIKKALDIVVKLQAILDFERGGPIAISLDDLYTKCTRQLSLANALNDLEALEDVSVAVQEIKAAWVQIGNVKDG